MVEQVRRRDARRKIAAKEPRVRRAERFMPSWKGPVFGEREVTEAEFTKADSSERLEMQVAVEKYLKNGGKITKYGDQAAKIEVEGEIKWQIEKSEEKYQAGDGLSGASVRAHCRWEGGAWPTNRYYFQYL